MCDLSAQRRSESDLHSYRPSAHRVSAPIGAFSGATAIVATRLGYPIVLWVFEFNQHGESPTANLDRTVVADALISIILGREGNTLNCEVVIEVLPPFIDATCGRGFRSSRCRTSWLPGMTRSPQDHPTTLFPPLTL